MDVAVGELFAMASRCTAEDFDAYLHSTVVPRFAHADLPHLRVIDPQHRWSALHLACAQNNPRLVANLLRCPDVNVNQSTPQYLHTPLHIAASCGAADVIRVLAANHARLDAKDAEGFTALHHAAAQGYRAAVEELLRALGDHQVAQAAIQKDNFGNSAHEIAFQCANGKCAEVIGDFVNRFVPQAGGTDEETEELKRWLRDVVKLPQYFVYFVKNGYTRLSYWSAKGISREEYESIGVVLSGHQRIINHFLEEYQRVASARVASAASSDDDEETEEERASTAS